jgi:hypothetical protein
MKTQLDECALDFAITPAWIFLGELEYQNLKFFVDRWLTTLVPAWVSPFLANEFTMPAENGFRLKNPNNLLELVRSLVCEFLQLDSENRQR